MLTPTTLMPAESSAAGFDAAAGEPTSLPGLSATDDAIRDCCDELGMWSSDGMPCFGQTRAWALERASDLLMRAEDARLMSRIPDPQDMAFALAWIAYAQACRESQAAS